MQRQTHRALASSSAAHGETGKRESVCLKLAYERARAANPWDLLAELRTNLVEPARWLEDGFSSWGRPECAIKRLRTTSRPVASSGLELHVDRRL